MRATLVILFYMNKNRHRKGAAGGKGGQFAESERANEADLHGDLKLPAGQKAKSPPEISEWEKVHTQLTQRENPTSRASKAHRALEKELAFYQRITGVRPNDDKHPMIMRRLRHQTGWTRKSLPSMEHRYITVKISNTFSEEEKELAERVYVASWNELLQEVIGT